MLAAFEQAFARRPAVVYQTIVLKLRVTHDKQKILDITQKRVTNMTSEITQYFFDDLERIHTGETDTRLIRALLEMMVSPIEGAAQPVEAIKKLQLAWISRERKRCVTRRRIDVHG